MAAEVASQACGTSRAAADTMADCAFALLAKSLAEMDQDECEALLVTRRGTSYAKRSAICGAAQGGTNYERLPQLAGNCGPRAQCAA